MPGDIESVQAPTYFFFVPSQAVTPRPSKVMPGIISDVKDVTRQRPPHPSVSSCRPVDRIVLPSGVTISSTASHVPASAASIWCSGPGGGGIWARAAPGAAVMITAATVHAKAFIIGPPVCVGEDTEGGAPPVNGFAARLACVEWASRTCQTHRWRPGWHRLTNGDL